MRRMLRIWLAARYHRRHNTHPLAYHGRPGQIKHSVREGDMLIDETTGREYVWDGIGWS